MFLWIIITASLFFWGNTLLVKSAVEESSINIRRVQLLLGFIMYGLASWAILVYST